MLSTSPMSVNSKIKSGLVKDLVHFNVYYSKFLTKHLFWLAAK